MLSGGLNDLLKQFQQSGHGDAANSWVGTGPNRPISPNDLSSALGADQIQSLAVTSRARLRSLFIDEGFGALDPEVLEVASEALSHLGGQDRLVGVITHVSELAERLPVRIEVKKLPTGSRLERVS